MLGTCSIAWYEMLGGTLTFHANWWKTNPLISVEFINMVAHDDCNWHGQSHRTHNSFILVNSVRKTIFIHASAGARVKYTNTTNYSPLFELYTYIITDCLVSIKRHSNKTIPNKHGKHTCLEKNERNNKQTNNQIYMMQMHAPNFPVIKQYQWPR